MWHFEQAARPRFSWAVVSRRGTVHGNHPPPSLRKKRIKRSSRSRATRRYTRTGSLGCGSLPLRLRGLAGRVPRSLSTIGYPLSPSRPSIPSRLTPYPHPRSIASLRPMLSTTIATSWTRDVPSAPTSRPKGGHLVLTIPPPIFNSRPPSHPTPPQHRATTGTLSLTEHSRNTQRKPNNVPDSTTSREGGLPAGGGRAIQNFNPQKGP